MIEFFKMSYQTSKSSTNCVHGDGDMKAGYGVFSHRIKAQPKSAETYL